MIIEHLSDIQLQNYALEEGEPDASIHQHLLHCEQCNRKIMDFRSLLVEIKELPKPVPDYDLFALVLATLPQPPVKARQDRLTYILVFAAFGSMALPVFILWDYFSKMTNNVLPLAIWIILTIAILIIIIRGIALYKDYKNKIATIHLHAGLI